MRAKNYIFANEKLLDPYHICRQFLLAQYTDARTNSCWKKLEEKHTRFQAHFRFLVVSSFCVPPREESFRGRSAGSSPEFRVASVLLLMF